MINDINDFFNKKFEFTNNERWSLPLQTYKSAPWEIEKLQKMKTTLNTCKGQLKEFPLAEWSKHTKYTDSSGSVIRTISTSSKIELLTQAWCKFYECLHNYPIVSPQLQSKKLNTLHLCEAPGAFISALNYFLYVKHPKLKWKWLATTLNPYYEGNNITEMIYDDRLIRQTLTNWEFGVDRTGDLRKYYNHKTLISVCKDVMLVTADGSVDCMKDPGEQERHVHFLHYCEVMTALKVLCEGGNFVLKLFTMFEHETICLMYLLNCTFKHVHVFKPSTSKSGNSEVYVICLEYKGGAIITNIWDSLIKPYVNGQPDNTAMFTLEDINCSFVTQLEECAQYFMDLQCDRINTNIQLFNTEDENLVDTIENIKELVAIEYIKKFEIPYITKRRRLMRSHVQRQLVSDDWDFKSISVSCPCVINIEIGLRIDIIYKSEFGHIPHKLQEDDVIYNVIKEYLPKTFVSVSRCCFDADVKQYEFFCLIKNCLDKTCDVVLYGVPLLTRFMIGIVYILACGFETVTFYKAGGITFCNRNVNSINSVKMYFDQIMRTFANLKSDDFPMDILEVVDNNSIKNSHFYSLICAYNKGLYL